MKLKHIIIVISLVIVVAVGFVVYKVIGSLDEIIEAGIEKYGSEITQAEVTLDGVELDLSNGQASLLGLRIGNPQGFQTEYLMKLDEAKVILDINSITKDPVIVKEVLIQGPSVIYEMASGGSNIDTLTRNIESYTGTKPEEEKTEGPKLVIEDLYINDGQVNLSHSALKGKTMSAGLPDIHMEDIGKDEGGASPGEVAEQVMGKVKDGATTAVGSIKNLPGAVSEQLQGVGGTVKDKLSEAGEKLKGLFSRDE